MSDHKGWIERGNDNLMIDKIIKTIHVLKSLTSQENAYASIFWAVSRIPADIKRILFGFKFCLT